MAKGSHRPRKPRGAGISFEIADWGIDKETVKVGPWFTASYVSTMACCGEECEEGDEIRADGEGGYQGRCCYPGKND
jgi:hypothetical protein